MIIHVQFSNKDELDVINVFSGPQDPVAWPNMGEIEDDDHRHISFLANYPK